MNKYLVLSVSVLAVAAVIAIFEDNPLRDYDYTGIVHDVRPTSSGYVFIIDTSVGGCFKCYSSKEVSELGHYGVSGEFSDDGSIFFTSTVKCLDVRRL
ncbi:MAG: hypothetical protein J5674_05150 [Candidatus Methanomethylophilaceae archaeon]|nr:hypothetical protein [Candidatus Methanomethylophilaceae archaeon]